MPVERCQKDGKLGFRWGSRGKCYTYDKGNGPGREAARKKAAQQGQAIHARGGR